MSRTVTLVMILVLPLWSSSGQQAWTQINNGIQSFGVTLQSVAVDAHGRVYAGTSGGGIFLSTDNGQHWSHVAQDLDAAGFSSFAFSPSGHVFASSWYHWGGMGGVFRSGDDGATWTQVNNGLSDLEAWALAVNSSGDLFVGTGDSGVFRSIDDGDSWEPVSSDMGDLEIRSLAIDETDRIWVGTVGAGIYRSIDNGATWTQLEVDIQRLTITSMVFYRETILINTSQQGAYRSLDDGLTWSHVGGYPDAHLAVNSVGTVFSATRGRGILRSTDSGTTWEEVRTGLYDNDFCCFAPTPEDILIAATPSGKVYSSHNNGDSWTVPNSALTGTFVTSLTFVSNGHLFAGAYSYPRGIFRSSDAGMSWTPSGLTGKDILSLAATSNGLIFAGTENEGLYRSTDNGETWIEIGNGTIPRATMRAIAVTRENNIFVSSLDYGNLEASGVYRSTDNGSTWTHQDEGLTTPRVDHIAAFGDGVLFTASGDGFGNGFGVHRSTDNGETWEQLSNGSLDSNAIAITVTSTGTVLAGTWNLEGRIYRSTDLGESWTLINNGLSRGGITEMFTSTNGEIFAGREFSGAMSSTDDGATWVDISEGLNRINVTSFAESEDGEIFAGVYGSGVYRKASLVTGVGDVPPFIPERISLHQNYPNPFNPSTTIEYGLPQVTYVRLEVFNILGERVSVLKDGVQDAGYHSVVFDAGGLPSGIYFYRLQAGDFIETKKLVLVQ